MLALPGVVLILTFQVGLLLLNARQLSGQLLSLPLVREENFELCLSVNSFEPLLNSINFIQF